MQHDFGDYLYLSVIDFNGLVYYYCKLQIVYLNYCSFKEHMSILQYYFILIAAVLFYFILFMCSYKFSYLTCLSTTGLNSLPLGFLSPCQHSPIIYPHNPWELHQILHLSMSRHSFHLPSKVILPNFTDFNIFQIWSIYSILQTWI